ncbi:glycoside hydrolase family 127 protein [Bacillus alkalicellulosilyticus]|uniref:glycoside hydrolase family 127 protein n=1 Tax=Alkalihalobacterium alkalicellulosilyticum TaxID=1912214 RepID=UPI0009982FA1|nr:glycoside hydrolase family 127 protein [Bacillus alkalicellulosilyticus]
MVKIDLLQGMFKDSQEKGKEYLLYLDVDRLMAPCYEAVSLTPKKNRYGGWESTGISGHSIGHWLSAVAQMWTVTKDELLKQKLEYAIDELAYVQSFDKDGYVSGFSRECFDKTFTGDFEVENFSLAGQWVPWYSLHKIYAGLIDCYQLLGNDKALEVVIKLADWVQNGSAHLTDDQFQKMLTCEHGGMNEAMADLYLITGERGYLDLAIRFCHKAVLDPLAHGIDELEGKHANTQIPKVIGAAKLFNITRDEKYKKIAVFFWNQVTTSRSYMIGGNSKDEHFGPMNDEKLGVQTTETCNTYNMLKLTEIMFEWFRDVKQVDFYERALYNHILASQDPDSGMKTYFVSSQPGHFKVYCTPENSFWCCTGTGMENPARYTRGIYYVNSSDFYVNLFIPSTIEITETDFIVKQETNFPETDRTKLFVEKGSNHYYSLHIRVPYWIAGSVTALVNGKSTYTSVESGYLTIERKWNTGDTIEIHLPIDLHLYTAKDDPYKVGIMYGPIVLAGALGRENFPENDIIADHLALNNHPLIEVPDLVADKTKLSEWIKRVEGSPLRFETEAVGQPGDVKVTLLPFYNLHHQRYTMYWNLMNDEEFSTFVDKEREERKRLQTVTVDFVQPSEQQPEVEHGIKSLNSNAGYFHLVQRGWRDARDQGYFSYKMKVEEDKKMGLEVTYFGGDRTIEEDNKTYEREFDILIDGVVIASQKLESNASPVSTFDVRYSIPYELTEGKTSVEVTFRSNEEGKIAGGVYGVRMTK